MERTLADAAGCRLPRDIQAVRSDGNEVDKRAGPNRDEEQEPRHTNSRKTITARRHASGESGRGAEYETRMAATKRRSHGKTGSRGGREPGKRGAAQSTENLQSNTVQRQGRGMIESFNMEPRKSMQFALHTSGRGERWSS
jgi:hypothetical protein